MGELYMVYKLYLIKVLKTTVAFKFKWSNLNALLHKILCNMFLITVYVNHKHLCPCPYYQRIYYLSVSKRSGILATEVACS